MKALSSYSKQILQALDEVSTPEKSKSSQRYFPQGVQCLGATAPDIKLIISQFHREHNDLTPNEVLEITESLLANAQYNEEFLVAFGLINKFVKKHYDDDLLLRFEYWLEHYADNWSLVDDLCLKSIYQFLMARPHLIDKMQHWAHSEVPWCRRASNVVWVKFINRKIGKHIYCLDPLLVFKQCSLLIADEDEFVQKSVGWLLKVTAAHHHDSVVAFLKNKRHIMPRATVRYAIEKMDKDCRADILDYT